MGIKVVAATTFSLTLGKPELEYLLNVLQNPLLDEGQDEPSEQELMRRELWYALSAGLSEPKEVDI